MITDLVFSKRETIAIEFAKIFLNDMLQRYPDTPKGDSTFPEKVSSLSFAYADKFLEESKKAVTEDPNQAKLDLG